MWFWLFFFVLFVLFLLYLVGTRGYGHFEKYGVKCLRPFPLLGNVSQTVFTKESFPVIMDKFYYAFPNERYIGFYEFSKPALWIRDPELIKKITIEDFDHFTDHRSVFSDSIDPLFSKSLSALKGKNWRDTRSTLSPAFTSSMLKSVYPLIIDCSIQLIDFFDDQLKCENLKGYKVIETETKDLFTRYANDVIASCVFGIEVNSHKNKTNSFYSMGKKISDFDNCFFIKYMLTAGFPKLMKFLGVGFLKQDEADYFRSLVVDTMKYRRQNNIIRRDLLQIMIDAKHGAQEDNFSDSWSDDEIASQAFAMFLAGLENISTALSFAAYEIATREDVQKHLQAEVDEVTQRNSYKSYETFSKLNYMDMFLAECLRLWPPEITIDRVCVKPYRLPPANKNAKEYQMNVGDLLLIPTRCIQRDPEYFPEPDRFIPERFSCENRTSIKHCSTLAFGSGPRSCIGIRFAMMEIKIVLAQMLLRYDFVVISKTENPSRATLEFSKLLPVNGMWIGLKLRQKRS